MPEPFSADQLNQLRQRWERDPKSRAFLQLAEEYRRSGQLSEALHILRVGLEEHPNYLSAQVAFGRCLVESGSADEAVGVLERAVVRDPTQLVANKLLVEAYLALGQPDKARERLNLYKLFNDRDSDIQPLEARIRALEAPPSAVTMAAAAPAPRETAAAVVFDLPPVAPAAELRLDSFNSARATTAASLSEPFGTLYPPAAVMRIDAALVEQAIFPLVAKEPPRPVAVEPAELPVEVPAPVQWEGATWPEQIAESEAPSVEAPPETEAGFEGEPLPEPATASPLAVEAAAPSAPTAWQASLAEAVPEPQNQPAPPLPEAAPAASSTLGELYLAQGHFDEAEKSFQSVLQSRPGDAAALAGLESVRLQRGEEAAIFSEEIPVAEEPSVIVGGLSARKAALLKDYLARLRRGAKRHVS